MYWIYRVLNSGSFSAISSAPVAANMSHHHHLLAQAHFKEAAEFGTWDEGGKGSLLLLFTPYLVLLMFYFCGCIVYGCNLNRL